MIKFLRLFYFILDTFKLLYDFYFIYLFYEISLLTFYLFILFMHLFDLLQCNLYVLVNSTSVHIFLTSLTFDMYYRHMLCISNELCFVVWYLFWYFIQIYFVITCILTYFWILGHDDCILFYIDYVLSLLCLGFELSIWHIYYESCVMILYLLSCLWANLINYLWKRTIWNWGTLHFLLIYLFSSICMPCFG